MITLQMFTKGFYVLGFDLTRDREADEKHISLPCQGKLRIEPWFKKTTTRTRHLHFLCSISWTHRNRQLSKRHSRVNIIQIGNDLTKHIKYFQDV